MEKTTDQTQVTDKLCHMLIFVCFIRVRDHVCVLGVLIFVCFIRRRDHVCVLGVLIFVCFIRGRDHVCVLGVLIFVCFREALFERIVLRWP